MTSISPLTAKQVKFCITMSLRTRYSQLMHSDAILAKINTVNKARRYKRQQPMSEDEVFQLCANTLVDEGFTFAQCLEEGSALGAYVFLARLRRGFPLDHDELLMATGRGDHNWAAVRKWIEDSRLTSYDLYSAPPVKALPL